MSIRDSLDRVGDGVRGFLQGLSPRDRALLVFMVVMILGGIGYFAQGAMVKASKKVKGQLAAASMAQHQVDTLLREYNSLAGTAEALDALLAAGADFTPLSWLEQLGNDMGIGANIKSITERGVDVTDYYRAQKIDIDVRDLNLPQVVELLHRLEGAAQAIWISEASVLTDHKDRNKLRLRLQISVLKPLGEA